MKEFFLLRLLDRFKKLFQLAGVDYQVMRCILQVKLTLDGRRVPTVYNRNKNTDSPDKNRYLSSLLMYFIFGLFTIPLLIIGDYFMIQMTIIFSVFMFMITTSMISDFSTVMLDIKEKSILHSKPIHAKTINMAKFIHILYYLTTLTLVLSLPALFVSLLRFGFIFFLIFILELILINLFIIFITSFIYLIILKFYDGEKLKDMINYVQIFLTIVMTVGFQVVGQTFRLIDLELSYQFQWWHYLIPPLWFSAPFEVLINHNLNLHYIILSIIALVIPILSIMLYIKLIPSFESNLQKLNTASTKVKKTRNQSLKQRLISIICRNKEERIFYQFASEMMNNEREFKLKIYPSLGFALIFPFIFMLNPALNGGFNKISESKFYLYIYFCAMMLPTILMTIKYSSNYKGAWVYKTIPIKNLSIIVTGTLKAFIVKLLLPVYLIECIIFLIIFGPQIWIHLIVVFISMLIYSSICYNILDKGIPFSQSNEEQVNQGGTAMLLMLLLGIFAIIHLGVTFITHGIYIYALILLITNFIVWRTGFKLTWNDLEKK